ncbi:MAG: TetR/AcrR family transcriptional regulator [Sphingobacteriales bacterium]|nr:MAG: TetR/AcrR family transcriptional regulator [Sphingobacteriales bacterium]
MGRKYVSKTRNKNLDKRNFYLQKLLYNFKIHGTKKLSIDKLANELGISKSTLYEYFKSKDEIVGLLLDDILFKIRDAEKILNDKHSSYIDRYYHSIDLISEHLSDISNVLLDDLKNDYPTHWKNIEALIEYLSDILTIYYDEGKKLGYFKNIDTRILVLSDRLFFNAISDTTYLKKNNISLKILFDEYFKMKSFGFIKTEA